MVVLGVSNDQGNIEKVKTFVKDNKLTFPNLHDPKAEATAKYGVRGFPTTFFVNAKGEVAGSVVGPRPWDNEDVDRLVELLLADSEK